MKKFVKFTDIGQFRNAIKDAPKEKIELTGTVKLHGTNAGILLNKDGYFHAQSRNSIIMPNGTHDELSDNAGFAQFVHENIDAIKETFMPRIHDEIVLFGEWCGKGIQKGVAINELDKMFVVFAIKVGDLWALEDEMLSDRMLRDFETVRAKGVPIWSIYEFPTFKETIDFSMPMLISNRLGEITKAVEDECPVAKQFGVSGIGEGVVWVNFGHNIIFKVKGEKHSISKVKTLAPVDIEKLNAINEFIDYAVTENRLRQGYDLLTGHDITQMGVFLRWMFDDIIEEESDVIEGNGLDRKEIGKYISARARTWFLSELDK